MKTLKLLLYYILFIGWTFSCKLGIPETLNTSLSVEQKALNIFYDSILYKKVYNIEDSSISMLGIDSTWITNGVLLGHSIYSCRSTVGITEPPFQSIELYSVKKYYDDSTLVEAIGYLNFYDSIRNDSTKIIIELPKSIIYSTMQDFLKRDLADEVYVEIKKNIKSKHIQMVELVIYKNIQYDPIFEISTKEWRFKFLFDLEGNFINWYE